jgi:tetratricopeptide (TPR) repeat protein
MSQFAATEADLKRAAQAMREAETCFLTADFNGAEELYTEALEFFKIARGRAYLDEARCRLGLGRVRNTQGRFDEARVLVDKTLAPFHQQPLDLAAAYYALGEIIANQGDLRGGLDMLNRSYEVRLQELGPSHPDTLESMSLLALYRYVRGEKQAAYQMIQQAVDLAEQPGGALFAVFGRVYNRQGRILMDDPKQYPAARGALEHALTIFERCEGAEHPDNGVALNNLANLLARRHQWAEAQQLLERSLLIHEKVYGTQSPFIISVLGNLTDIEKDLGNLEAAYRYAARALVLSVSRLGARSSQTLAALRRLVLVQVARSNAGDPHAMQFAIPFYQCLSALEAADGKRDPLKEIVPGVWLPPAEAARRLERLVDGLRQESEQAQRSPEEQAAYEQARAAVKKIIEQGDTALQQGYAARARHFYQQALAAQEDILGPSHLDHLPLLEKLAQTSELTGHPTAVLPLRTRIAGICSDILGEEHPETLLAMSNLYQRTQYEYGKEAAYPFLMHIYDLREINIGADFPTAASRTIKEQVEKLASLSKTRGPQQGPSLSERIEAALAKTPPDPQGVLAGLEDVDWQSVRHAFGLAIDTPQHIRLLLSEDELVRADAWEALANSIFHQTTFYEATPIVIPFLVRMLELDGPPDRFEVLIFLEQMAECAAALARRVLPGTLKVDWSVIRSMLQNEELERDLRQGLTLAEQVNRAISAGTHYQELLNDPDPEVQILALQILSHLQGLGEQDAAKIMAQLGRISVPSMRAVAMRALRVLLDDSQDSVDFFNNGLSLPGEDARVVFQAAAGVIERTGKLAPQQAVERLTDSWQAIQRLAGEAKAPQSYHGLAPLFQAQDLRVLVVLGPERSVPALSRALALTDDSETLLELAGMILDILFNGGQLQEKSTAQSSPLHEGQRVMVIDYWSPPVKPVGNSADLSKIQCSTLAILLQMEAFWRVEHNLLSLYGLPAKRADLKRFLDMAAG